MTDSENNSLNVSSKLCYLPVTLK